MTPATPIPVTSGKEALYKHQEESVKPRKRESRFHIKNGKKKKNLTSKINARRQWANIFHVLKKHNWEPKFLKSGKMSFASQGKLQFFKKTPKQNIFSTNSLLEKELLKKKKMT